MHYRCKRREIDFEKTAKIEKYTSVTVDTADVCSTTSREIWLDFWTRTPQIILDQMKNICFFTKLFGTKRCKTHIYKVFSTAICHWDFSQTMSNIFENSKNFMVSIFSFENRKCSRTDIISLGCWISSSKTFLNLSLVRTSRFSGHVDGATRGRIQGGVQLQWWLCRPLE